MSYSTRHGRGYWDERGRDHKRRVADNRLQNQIDDLSRRVDELEASARDETATYKNGPDLAQTPPESGTQIQGSE